MSNLRKEIKRSIKNKFFYISCIIGIILSLICVFKAVKDYSDYAVSLEEVEMINLNPLVPTLSAYTLWIGGGESNLYSTMMFLMLPLLVSLPYAWSYCFDRKNGYLKKAVNEIGSLKYNLSKYVATFISSSLVIVIPLIINLLSVLMFVPAITPDSVYDIYYGVFSYNFLGDVFYTVPILYDLIYILMIFLFCGLIGCLGYSFAVLLKSRILAVISPSALLLFIHYKKQYIGSFDFEISTISFLSSATNLFYNIKTVIIEAVILFVFTFIICVLRKEKILVRK